VARRARPRKFTVRFVCGGSSLAKSRSTWVERSIFQAMPLYCHFERDGLFFPAADAVQSALGEIYVLEIVEMLAEGMDKWAAAINATLGKMSAAERDEFANTTVTDSRRDIMARVTGSGHK
jgi:hypothetical protein